ncbi:MAG TPA: Flp pilus assembly protein CpaB [Chloroflexi bacterium]|nr:Flp pilus assembly protein CpaB [Chloroflexota bacterium]
MRGGRLLLIIGGILVVAALAVGGILLMKGQKAPQEPAGEGEMTPVSQEPQVEIVVAAQELSKGTTITEEMLQEPAPAVTLKPWPEDEIPMGAITDLEEVVGRTLRTDATPDLPILASMLMMAPTGSSAALQIPEGQVAYALPVSRYSSVAWALQPGDYVDVIISLLLVDLDEEFQTIEPNQARCLSPSDDPACVGMGGPMGRLEVMPNGWLVNLTPAETQRPRLVTQLTVQNAKVLRVGDWPQEGEEEGEAIEPTPTPPIPTEAEAAGGETPAETRPVYAPLTLAVSRQDAMVLDYAQLIGAHITFVLRRTGDNKDEVSTESVTLQYMMEQFNIEVPEKSPYGVDPRIPSLTGVDLQAATEYQPESETPEQ